ncbi:MAG: nucleotidyltransferase domain-containing protein [Bacteroidia bacterium]
MMENQIVQKINTYLESQPVDKAWIFGSYARNQQNDNSDIDLMISFSKNSKITLFKYADMLLALEKITGRKVDLVEEGQIKYWAKAYVEKDKILIYERRA